MNMGKTYRGSEKHEHGKMNDRKEHKDHGQSSESFMDGVRKFAWSGEQDDKLG